MNKAIRSEIIKILPKKRALSSIENEHNDWDIQTVEWNDSIDASVDALLKRVATIQEIRDEVGTSVCQACEGWKVCRVYACRYLTKMENKITEALQSEFLIIRKEKR